MRFLPLRLHPNVLIILCPGYLFLKLKLLIRIKRGLYTKGLLLEVRYFLGNLGLLCNCGNWIEAL